MGIDANIINAIASDQAMLDSIANATVATTATDVFLPVLGVTISIDKNNLGPAELYGVGRATSKAEVKDQVLVTTPQKKDQMAKTAIRDMKG